MPILENIEREHIFQAMLKVHREGIPKYAAAHKYAVVYEKIQYPCK